MKEKLNITHRDIKPQNILIFNGRYKLCDFGEIRVLKRDGLIVQRIRGSELYMSPILFYGLRNKLLQVRHNTYKSDVFSLGMCLFFAAGLSYRGPVEIREVSDMKQKEFILNKNVKDIVDRPYAKEPRIREIKAPDVFMKNFIEKQPGLFDKNSIINGKEFSEYKENFKIKEPTFEDDRFDFKLRDDNRVGKNIDRDSHAEGIDGVEMTEDDRFDYKMRDDNAVGKDVDRDSHAEGIDGEDITKDDRFDFKVRGDNATGKDEDRDMNAEGIDGKEISEDSKIHLKEEKKEEKEKERSSWDDELSFS